MNNFVQALLLLMVILSLSPRAVAFNGCKTSPGYVWETLPDPCRIDVGGTEVIFFDDLKILFRDGKKLKMHLHQDDVLVDLYLEKADNVYVALYRMGTESSTSVVAALNFTDLKPLWHKYTHGFGSSAKIVGNDIYIAGSNSVARLNIKTGKSVWQHDNLNENWGFSGVQSGGSITFEQDTVLFTDGSKVNVKVDNKSGKILSINKTYSCQESITVHNTVENVPLPWKTLDTAPEEKANKKFLTLAVYQEDTNKKIPLPAIQKDGSLKWNFLDSDSKHKKTFGISCKYNDTDSVLFQKIFSGANSCSSQAQSNSIVCI